VDRALELVANERPVLLKRDPVLHKHGIQAFKPRLVSGNAIKIHPLVTSGFNADFDGDAMSVYVPIGRDAVTEARKMFPSNNLFNEATGRVAFQPTLDSALGLYKLSRIGKDTKKRFKDPAAALNATKDGKLGITDLIHVSKVGKTTPGRLLLSTALPEEMRKDVLTKHDKLLDKEGINSLFTTLATKHKGDFGTAADKLKDLGNGMAFGAIAIPHPDHKGLSAIKAAEDPKRSTVFIPTGTHTLSLDDFTPDRALRDKILGSAQKRVNMIQSSSRAHPEEKERLVNKIWGAAADEMRDKHIAKEKKNPSNLFLMQEAGVKPGWDQYKQLVLAPVQVTDAANRIVPIPIKKSYAEGLDLGGYWTQSHGARRGTVMKVQEVREPGFFSKNLMNTSMNLVINGNDCGTTRGVALDATSPDLYDRELARDFSARGLKLKAGTMLDPPTVDKIRSADKNAQLIVRSSLKCEHGEGLCQKCAGIGADGSYHNIGTNIGAVSAQSLGERAVQLTLKAFHSGGVRTQGSSRVLNDFGRVQQLTSLPENIPDAASLAMKSGKIEKIDRDKLGARIWIGGKDHYVGKDRGGFSLYEDLSAATRDDDYVAWRPPKVGMKVEAGQFLSDPNRTFLNPHDLYRATNNMEKVQNHLVKELHGIYSTQGVRRTHIETMVKAMSNLTKVRAPGDAEGILKGEYQPASVIRALNTKLVKVGKRPVMHSPILKGVNVMPLVMQEDWMAKLQHQRLRDTIMEGAASAAVSNLHGLHPVPAAAYGAEFGLTLEQSARPGLRHLADVSPFKY
jgi:DNA-directed RNA polymerase subunit beta'